MKRTYTKKRAYSKRKKEETENYVKHTGAKMGFFQNGNFKGEPWVSGWNYSKQNGLVSILCGNYHGSKTVTSDESGRAWTNVICKIKKRMCADQIVMGMMDMDNYKVYIKDLGIVINPKAPNGGYCGQYDTKK